MPQLFPLPRSLQAPGVGRQDGYFALFSPFCLPHGLHLVLPDFLSLRQVLQSTQPPFLPGAPLRLNQSLKELSLLPSGSLGKTYADELIRQGFSPDELMDSGEVTNLKSFVSHRLHETHDIIHVLTGFGTDLVGEMGLQAFTLAQNRAPLAVLLIAGSLLRALQNDEPLEPLLSALSRGFELGLNANLVIAYKLEDQWELSVEEWRKTLNIMEPSKI